MNIYVALLVGYSAALTALGLWIARKVRGPADFFVAGRRLTWPYIAATMLAANIGAGATVAATGLAYQEGVNAWFWNASAGLGSLVLATVVGPRIWALAAETMADAIVRAVREATGVPGYPAVRDLARK